LKRNLIVIAGPTAVGKTAISIELAKHFKCPVISADSRQFFKEMNIGTAKPTTEEMGNIQHHFIGHKSIYDAYDAGQFEKDAIDCIEQLFVKNNTLIVVGGSGLYIDALLNGIDEFEKIPPEIREKLIKDYQQKGIGYLQEELKKRDPEYYRSVDLNNPQRLMRALEVCIHTGKPYTGFRKKEKKHRSFEAFKILINTSRETLYKKINDRVDQMMKDGLLEEAKALYANRTLNALNTVGYKELFSYLDGTLPLQEAIELIKQNTRRYAKRQLTWFNHQDEFESFEPTEAEMLKAYLDLVFQYT
jgi:tRNA dimethylallyltransferase